MGGCNLYPEIISSILEINQTSTTNIHPCLHVMLTRSVNHVNNQHEIEGAQWWAHRL